MNRMTSSFFKVSIPSVIPHLSARRLLAFFAFAVVTLTPSIGAAQAPPEWTCTTAFYEDGLGCDCDCGAFDPDCSDSGQAVLNCNTGNDGCNLDGECRYVPAEWTCIESFFNAGDQFCDCACGAYDPDCDDAGNVLAGCAVGAESCNSDGTCRDVPDAWTCPESFWDGRDGFCDCACGAPDPDCDTPGSILAGCPAGTENCNADGTCNAIPAAWTCNDTYYAANDGCDCACGAYDPDCDDATSTLLGCPNNATGCNADGSCNVVPAAWTCNDNFYGADDGCDCACGAYDPDCDTAGTPLLGCPAGATSCNEDGTCFVVPAEWTCSANFYDDDTFCDCECGATDPDCADASNSVLGCSEPNNGCNADATCNDVPAAWTCAVTAFNNGDGCDCGCGAYDLDCADPAQALFGCPAGASGCGMDGECEVVPAEWTCAENFYEDGTFCDCACGTADPDCDDATNSVFGCGTDSFGCNADGTCDVTPPEWTCSDTWWEDGNFCDCGCGAADPDCADPTTSLFGCPQEATGCSVDGVCELPMGGPPPEWFCNPATFGTGDDGCDCGCGAYDPDCDAATATLYGCPQGSETCKSDGTCEDPPVGPPPEWTCPATFYSATDGCDCNCGAPDPDCDIAGQNLFGCPVDVQTCNADGTCAGPVGGGANIPPGWTCTDETYATGDGCHCECGVYDPDCDEPSQELKGCPADAIGCSTDAECRVPMCTPDCTDKACGGDGCGGSCGSCGPDETCNTGTCESNDPGVVPPAWTCAPAAYADGTNCDCACGAVDPDCSIAAAPVFGCAQGVACAADGTCEEVVGPDGWTCNISYYGAADGCDCNCGVYDPDCDLAESQLYGCTPGATGCAMDATCIGGAAPPPDGWTCPASGYNAMDGCDCSCGIYDPDCDDPDATIYGCTQNATGCNAAGECVEPTCTPDCGEAVCGDDGCGGSCGSCAADESCSPSGRCEPGGPNNPGPDPEPGVEPDPTPPDGWTCAGTNYDSLDGCHCGCGVIDPDCGDPAADVIGCGAAAVGCDMDGKCIEECTPGCGSRICGVDDCGDVCGICDEADFCSAEGACLPRVIDDGNDADGGRGNGDSGDGASGCNACTSDARLPWELSFAIGFGLLALRRRRRG